MDYYFCDEIIEPIKKLVPMETIKKNDTNNYLYNDYTERYCLKRSFSLQTQANMERSGYIHSSNVVNYLLDKYKDDRVTIDNFLINLLVASIELRQFKKMNFVLKKGVDVNKHNSEGRSPLIMAVYTRLFSVVKMLIEEYKADLNAEYANDHEHWRNIKNMAEFIVDEHKDDNSSEIAKKIYEYITNRLQPSISSKE